MTEDAVLADLERRLLDRALPAAAAMAYSHYAVAELPDGDHPQIAQGFRAGYMAGVRAATTEIRQMRFDLRLKGGVRP